MLSRRDETTVTARVISARCRTSNTSAASFRRLAADGYWKYDFLVMEQTTSGQASCSGNPSIACDKNVSGKPYIPTDLRITRHLYILGILCVSRGLRPAPKLHVIASTHIIFNDGVPGDVHRALDPHTIQYLGVAGYRDFRTAMYAASATCAVLETRPPPLGWWWYTSPSISRTSHLQSTRMLDRRNS